MLPAPALFRASSSENPHKTTADPESGTDLSTDSHRASFWAALRFVLLAFSCKLTRQNPTTACSQSSHQPKTETAAYSASSFGTCGFKYNIAVSLSLNPTPVFYRYRVQPHQG